MVNILTHDSIYASFVFVFHFVFVAILTLFFLLFLLLCVLLLSHTMFLFPSIQSGLIYLYSSFYVASLLLLLLKSKYFIKLLLSFEMGIIYVFFVHVIEWVSKCMFVCVCVSGIRCIIYILWWSYVWCHVYMSNYIFFFYLLWHQMFRKSKALSIYWFILILSHSIL